MCSVYRLYEFMSRIRFEIIPPIESPNDPVFVTGGISELGDWHPGSALALRWEPPYHVGTIDVPMGVRFEYKITRGAWEREAVDAWGHVPENTDFTPWLDATIRKTVADWKDRYAGRLTTDRVWSERLASARDLFVWLPPEYTQRPGQRFPVLYLFDGDNVFDPASSPISGIDWAADEWCRVLTREGVVAPTIVVGVRHPAGHGEDGRSARELDLSLDYGGRGFSDFAASELVGYIDSRYRTLSDRLARTIAGASLGGLNAAITLWRHPCVFSKAICFSTSFEDTAEHLPGQCPTLLRLQEMQHLPDASRMYFAYGDEGIDECYAPYHQELGSILRERGWLDGRDFKIVQMKGGGHGEGSWRLWLGDAMKFVCQRA